MKLLISSLVFLSTLVLAIPNEAIAQGLVTCSGADCTICSLALMTNNIIQWLFGFLTVCAVFVFVFAGVKLVTSGGDTQARDFAKARLTAVIVGFILMLSSWLIVDTILQGLTGTGLEVWGNFDVNECGGQRESQQNDDLEDIAEADSEYEFETYIDGGVINEAGIPAPSATAPISTAPAVITGTLVTYAGAQFDSGIVAKVQYVATTFSLRVSGGFRTPERNREVGGVANSNHLTGRAADFVGTQANMQAARQWARNNGAREALIHNAGSGTHLHLAW